MRPWLLVLAAAMVGCRPHPQPPAGGDTTSADSTRPDSMAADTGITILPSDTQSTPEDTVSTAVPDVTAQDTLPAVPADSAPPAARRMGAVRDSGPVGLPAGLSAPPVTHVGEYGTTGAYQGVNAKLLLGILRKSAYQHFARIVAMPRKRQTVDGTLDGRYSARAARAEIDAIAKIPVDSLRKYVALGVLRGYSIIDDAGCGTCYGNRPITLAQIDSVYSYADQKLPPFLPVGMRIHPTWLAQQPSLSRYLDFMWVQHVDRRGDQMAWYNRQAAYAKTLPHPVAVVYGLNFRHFHRDNSPITAAELDRMGPNAITMPGNCFFSGFTWSADWRGSGRGAVWDRLLILAKQQNAPSSCAAPQPVIPPDSIPSDSILPDSAARPRR